MYQAAVAQWGLNFANTLDLSPYKNILEVGCRQGVIAKSLSAHYPQNHFLAIDNLEAEIDHAQQYAKTNLDFAVMDALTLPFQNQFDAIISFNCLFWIQNKRRVLQQLYQSLVPGGKAYLQFFATHGRARNDYFVYQTAKEANWQNYFNRFYLDYYEINLKEFCTLLQATGFIIHRLGYSTNPTTLKNEDELAHFIESWSSHGKFLPQQKKAHFFHEVGQAYLKHYHYEFDKPFTYSECLLEAVCEKPCTEPANRTGYEIFSERETQVLKHYLLGKSAKEIGIELGISPKTIEFHICNIKNQLNCSKRSEVYQAAIAHGFINLIFDSSK